MSETMCETREMTHWRVTIKEWNTLHPIESDNISHKSREQIIEFYGLRNPDVEWYRIEVVKDKKG